MAASRATRLVVLVALGGACSDERSAGETNTFGSEGLPAELELRPVEVSPRVRVDQPTLEFLPPEAEGERGEAIQVNFPLVKRSWIPVDPETFVIGRFACLVEGQWRVDVVSEHARYLDSLERLPTYAIAFPFEARLDPRPSECVLELDHGTRWSYPSKAEAWREAVAPMPERFRWTALGGEAVPPRTPKLDFSDPVRVLGLSGVLGEVINMPGVPSRGQRVTFHFGGAAWIERGTAPLIDHAVAVEGACKLANGELIRDETELITHLWPLEPGDVSVVGFSLFGSEYLPPGTTLSDCELSWRLDSKTTPRLSDDASRYCLDQLTDEPQRARPGPC